MVKLTPFVLVALVPSVVSEEQECVKGSAMLQRNSVRKSDTVVMLDNKVEGASSGPFDDSGEGDDFEDGGAGEFGTLESEAEETEENAQIEEAGSSDVGETEAGSTQPTPQLCNLELLCPGKILNDDWEIFSGRTCKHVLEKEGGWICMPGKENPKQLFQKKCCRTPDEPYPAPCDQERLCGPGKLLNVDWEIWSGRTCSHVLNNEGGWLCDNGKEQVAGWWAKQCCRDAAEEPPKPCTLERVCGAGATALRDPDYMLFKGRSCSHVLNNEGGWVCKEQSVGVDYFKNRCCLDEKEAAEEPSKGPWKDPSEDASEDSSE